MEGELKTSNERQSPSPASSAPDGQYQEHFAQVESVGAASASVPPEFLQKLSETEEMVRRLQQQNLSQKEELEAIHAGLEREARLRYRGCNHPSRSFRSRHASSSRSLDPGPGPRRGARVAVSQDSPSHYVSASRLDLAASRTSDRFPPLKAVAVPRSRRPR